MNYFKLGLRNIFRNFRRSIATAFAVAFGFAAINLFSGYIYNVYSGLGEQAVRGERLGHLTITKTGALSGGKLEPEKFHFSGDEIGTIESLLAEDRSIALVAPKLAVSGIVSNGSASTIFIGEGINPEDLASIQHGFRDEEDLLLNADHELGAAIAIDLASMLELQENGYAVLIGSTVSGQTNAIDIDVETRFNTGNAGTNDKFILLPLALVRQFLDTDGADRIVLLLKSGVNLESERDRIRAVLEQTGMELELHSWRELSSFYTQVKNLFDMIFSFIFSIVLVIVLMSIVNTMSMSVVERTREIGTLRALGMNGRKVIYLFTTEGLILVLTGAVLGVMVTGAIAFIVNQIEYSYTPPNNSNSVLLLIDFVPSVMIASLAVLAVVALIAAFLPARKAAKQSVVGALSHT